MKIEMYIDMAEYKHLLITEADRALAITVDLKMPNPTATSHIFKFGYEPKQKGTTTRLYQGAVELLQQYASSVKTPIEWLLTTKSPVMRAWMIHPSGGLKVVGTWDEIVQTDTETFATKFVRPAEPK